MVTQRRIRRFVRQEDGLALTEAMIILPIMLIVITTMIEFGVLVLQWNQSVKALQVGARLLAVSSPVVDDPSTTVNEYEAFMTNDWTGLDEGAAVPGTIRSISCGPGSSPCNTARMNRLLTGGDASCEPTTPAIDRLVGICDVAPWIRPDNLLVTYTRSGLGYVGRPNGSVTTITLELRNQTFDFFVLDALIPGISNIAIPPNAVNFTSEDLCDSKTC